MKTAKTKWFGRNQIYLAVIVFLPFVCENWANDIASILDHHLPSLDVPLAEKTSTVYSRSFNETKKMNTFYQVLISLMKSMMKNIHQQPEMIKRQR